MNGFIFKVSDLCHDEKGTVFRGKYFGGKVRSKEKILLVSPDRRIDTLFDNKQIHVVDLLINQEYGTDYLYIDVPFVGDNVSLKDDALWVVDSDLSSPQCRRSTWTVWHPRKIPLQLCAHKPLRRNNRRNQIRRNSFKPALHSAHNGRRALTRRPQ